MSSTNVLLPEPLTPVTTHNTPSGNSTVTSRRLLPRAPARRIQPWLGSAALAGAAEAAAARQVIAGEALGRCFHLARRSLKDDLARRARRPRADFDDLVRRADHRLFVLDHHHRIAAIAQPWIAFDQPRDVLGCRPTEGSSSTYSMLTRLEPRADVERHALRLRRR